MCKLTLLSVAAFCLVVIACKKDMNSATPASISGTWNWAATYSDGPASDSNPQTPAHSGTTESIRFDDKKNWLHLENGVVDDSGNYSLGHGSYHSMAQVFEYDSVVFLKDGRKMYWTAYVFSGDTLTYSPYAQGLVGGGAKLWTRQ